MKGNTHGHQPDTTIQSDDRDRKQKKQGHKQPKKPETWHHCEQAHEQLGGGGIPRGAEQSTLEHMMY
jgi:hypothetical protein